MNQTFKRLNLKPELLTTLTELGFKSMTPIQAGSLPLILLGKDIIAQAKTGSGKTAAFALGILNDLDLSIKDTHSLIVCPTRELAEQVAQEIRNLARTLKNVKVITLCGGSPTQVQKKSLLAGAHVVVGTPGRILHHLKHENLKVNTLQMFILDEADRMLDMGFYDDIVKISSHCPEDRQSMLFSATFPKHIRKLSQDVQSDAQVVMVDTDHDAKSIEQTFYALEDDQDKNAALYKVLCQHKPKRALVFCRTKQESNELANFLSQRGVSALSINGDLDQSERTKVLIKFSNQSISVLAATDVAARGLDIKELEAVINYSIPRDIEDYMHRIGRTGRAGHKGLAFSFFKNIEQAKLEAIEKATGKKCVIADLKKIQDVKKYDLTPPMQTMYISGGKKDKLRPGDILGALVGEAGLAGDAVGDISILNIVSYVAIKRESLDQVIEKMTSAKIKKRKFKVGKA